MTSMTDWWVAFCLVEMRVVSSRTLRVCRSYSLLQICSNAALALSDPCSTLSSTSCSCFLHWATTSPVVVCWLSWRCPRRVSSAARVVSWAWVAMALWEASVASIASRVASPNFKNPSALCCIAALSAADSSTTAPVLSSTSALVPSVVSRTVFVLASTVAWRAASRSSACLDSAASASRVSLPCASQASRSFTPNSSFSEA
mmetsp:Transcript_8155/g.20123  ORF Transcript_8155/g.20123 Transcript_8155/m.20123 type:complete len:202 (+) Transcript_8155:395-1000(+)